MTWTKADVVETIRRVRQAAKVGPFVLVTMDQTMAELFIDFLRDFDPDMPPRPVCKALGPLLGDTLMNAKLQRLDAIADKLGPLLIDLERKR
jgi:hypothetical protein